MNNATHQRLIVSREDDANELVRLGVVDFDESNRAKLSTEGSGSAVDELKEAWQEISQSPELTWKQSRSEELDGRKISRIVGVTAKPGDSNYIYAVLNTLQRKYGFAVDLEDD